MQSARRQVISRKRRARQLLHKVKAADRGTNAAVYGDTWRVALSLGTHATTHE